MGSTESKIENKTSVKNNNKKIVSFENKTSVKNNQQNQTQQNQTQQNQTQQNKTQQNKTQQNQTQQNKTQQNKNQQNQTQQNKNQQNQTQQKKNKNEIRLIKNLNNYSNFPKYKIEGGSGFESVKITLNPNQKIIANGGTMNYMSSGIVDTVQAVNNNQSLLNGFKKIVGRAFTGSSIFYNIYENTSSESQFVSFSSNIPGNIGTFIVPKDRELYIVSDSYICNTDNLSISGSTKFGGILLGYGLFFINVKLKDNQTNNGIVWVSSYGDLIEYNLKPGKKIIVNNGVFVAFDSSIDIQTRVVKGKNTTSTIKSFLFSGEGLISEMTNNTDSDKSIFLQSRSRIFYNDYIKSICSSEIEKKENSSIIPSIFGS